MADRVVKYVFQGDIKGLQASMSAASASVAKFGKDLSGLDAKGAKMRQGLTAVGDTAGKIGLVAAAGLGAVVLATVNFDKAMSNVQAATHETSQNMDLLREAALRAGKDTAFSATEAAAGIENLAKAGVSTSDILGGGLAGALDLAAAGEMEVADAAEVAATAMTQFNLEGSQVPHIADLLAAAAGKAQGEVSDMAAALKQSGLVASQMGLSIEETTGTLAAFASAGLLGSDAGTSFRTMLLRMANPSKEAADLMKELGINAYDAQGQFVGMESLAGQLSTAFEGQSQATRDAALATIFGSDAIRAASVLYSQGAGGIEEWTSKVDDAGYAAETAATRMDNLAGDLEKLKGSLETALIGSGSGAQGPLRSLVQGLESVVDAYNKLPPAAQGATTAMLGITAVTGGGLWLGAKVVQGIANTREALDNLGISAGRAGGALKALGYTAAGLTALYAIGKAIEGIEDAMLDAVPGVEKLTQSLLNLRDARVAEQFASEVGNIGTAIDRVTDAGMRAQGFDFMHGMGRQMSFLATSAEELASSVSGYESFAEAEQDIRALDAALANIVASGSPDAAAQALDDLAAAQGLSSAQMKALLSQMPLYEEALAGADNAATLAASGTDEFSGAMDQATAAAQEEAAALQQSIDAMREKRAAAIAAANAEIGYEAAVDDASASLKENGRTLDITTDKGRANKSALLNLAAAWNEQSDAVKGGEGARRAAIDQFVDLATKMGMDADKARDLARSLYEIPTKRNVDVSVNTSAARSQIAGFMNSLPTTHTVSIVAQRRGDWSGSGPGLASGGTVDGAPRHPYGDKVLTMLAPGEEVISNRYGQADRHRDLLKAINANRLADGGMVQHLAEGGRVRPESFALSAFGDQGAVMERQLLAQAAQAGSTQAAMAALVQRLDSLDERVESGAARGVAGLHSDLSSLATAVTRLPGEMERRRRSQ